MSTSNENEFWTTTKKRFTAENDLKTFKNWEVVRSIPLYVTHEFTEHYSSEVSTLLNRRNDRAEWFGVLREPFLGHTEDSYQSAALKIFGHVECTSWTLKSAHHILMFESMSGTSVHEYD